MSLYVYGVVRAGTPVPELAGVGRPPGGLSTVDHEDLGAVVSELGDGRTLTDDDAATHLDVLSSLDGPVLPLRFGTVAPDANAVRDEVLSARHDELLALLDELDGLVELRVEFTFDEQAVLRGLLAHDPDIRLLADNYGRGLDERIQLGQVVADQVTASCRERAEQLMEPHLPLVSDVRRTGSTEPHVDRWALLVPADRVSEMDERVGALRAAAPDVHIDYLGPFPAFSFLDDATARVRTSGSRWGW